MELTKTIASIERMRQSPDGNPRYRLVFTDNTSYPTGVDADVAYRITNSDYRNVPVVITLDRNQIVDIRVARDD